MSIHYVIKQETDDRNVWTSSELFAAEAAHDVRRAIRAGWLAGFARWAETSDGRYLFGITREGWKKEGALQAVAYETESSL